MSNFHKKTRSQKIRNRLKKVSFNRYRLSVFRSSKNISAQIIDDKNMRTLVSASSTEKKTFGEKKIKKIDFSVLLGEVLAKRAKEKKIDKVYFDRGGYKYHGRIKALAESLRKIILSSKNKITIKQEVLLLMASRIDHVNNIIKRSFP